MVIFFLKDIKVKFKNKYALSVIIPCLNEIDTIEKCINKCFDSFIH